jgi:protein involved in polysaccharide export with SLBB domain
MAQTPLALMASDRNRRSGGRGIGGFLAGVLASLLLLFSGLTYAQDSSADDADTVSGYQLGPRDSISVTVFNHPDLSGEFVLDGDGRFSMPLIGVVDATGKTPVELEEVLLNRFRPDYLVNPRISIEVRNYRPYYLIGEVQSTGSFPYVAGITYLTAIAMAGGYTYRAKKDVVYVIRGNDPKQEEIKLDANAKVQPGDIIRVAERLF